MTAFSDSPLAAGETPVGAPPTAEPAAIALPHALAGPGVTGFAAAGLAVAEVVDVEIDIDDLDETDELDNVLDPDRPDSELPGPELPAGERPSHLRVAPKASRGLLDRRRRAQLLVLGVAAISAASMFLLVTFHVFAAQSAFALDKLDTQLVNQQREYGLLRDKVATLSSPQAVATGAAELGMIRAPDVVLLHPPAAASFGATGGLPVPPPPPYSAIDDTGQ